MKNLSKVLLVLVLLLFINGQNIQSNNEDLLTQELLPTVEKPVVETLSVRATLYYPEESQTDSTPYITASSRLIDRVDPFNSKYIAVSSYMETIFPMGTRVKIHSPRFPELSGVYTVADRMNQRYSGTELIDILISKEMFEGMRYTSGIFSIQNHD